MKANSLPRGLFSNHRKTKGYSQVVHNGRGEKLPIILTVAYFYEHPRKPDGETGGRGNKENGK
jgi:hypothetical protein